MLVSALSLAIYGMFVAIVVPGAKKEKATFWCVVLAVALSCLFAILPVLKTIPDGFAIIICAVAASAFMAKVAPIKQVEEDENA